MQSREGTLDPPGKRGRGAGAGWVRLGRGALDRWLLSSTEYSKGGIRCWGWEEEEEGGPGGQDGGDRGGRRNISS